jgi:hypothetical protein
MSITMIGVKNHRSCRNLNYVYFNYDTITLLKNTKGLTHTFKRHIYFDSFISKKILLMNLYIFVTFVYFLSSFLLFLLIYLTIFFSVEHRSYQPKQVHILHVAMFYLIYTSICSLLLQFFIRLQRNLFDFIKETFCCLLCFNIIWFINSDFLESFIPQTIFLSFLLPLNRTGGLKFIFLFHAIKKVVIFVFSSLIFNAGNYFLMTADFM